MWCLCVCMSVCVVDREGNRVFASRTLAVLTTMYYVVAIDGSISDQLQRLSDQFRYFT